MALNEVIAERLDAAMVDRARERLEAWIERAGAGAELLEQWQAILERPLADIRAVLTDRGEAAAWLRKASPFAGALAPREREQILLRVRRQREIAG